MADGSVTTPKLADGAVTSAKIADGAVNQAKAPSLVRSPNGENYMIQSGTLTAGLTSSQVVNFDVTFPVAFSTTPVIVVSNCTNSSQQQWSGDSIAVYGESRRIPVSVPNSTSAARRAGVHTACAG